MLKWLPGLKSFGTNYFWNCSAQVLQELPISCSQLKDISLSLSGVEGKDLARYLGHANLRLSSVRLQNIGERLYASGIRPLLLQPRSHFLCNALVVVKTTYGFPMSSVLEVLAQCPNLHTLEVPNVLISGSEPEVIPFWASQKFRVLHLGFCLKEIEADTSTRSTQLSELPRLERFAINGLINSVGDTEVSWMAEHWPRLRSIRLPAANPAEGEEVQKPDYKKWFPSLVVEVELIYCEQSQEYSPY